MALSLSLVIKLLFVASFAGWAVYVHYRGEARLSFSRQLSDHSTLFAPLNWLIYTFSAVPNRPILDLADFPQLQPLMNNWQIIRDEAVQLQEQGAVRASDKHDDVGFNSFFRTGWKRFYVKWYDDPLPSARRQCPKTVALVNSIPSIKGAMFASLPPGATLVAHRDPFAGSIRFHLGLATPNDDRCRIYIDGKPYSWRDGEGIVFDETYIHKAYNETDKQRIILFCDVERPMRSRFAASASRVFSDHVMRHTAASNQTADPVGFINRAFKYVYKIRLAGKALKRWNRKVYYAVKFALVAGIVVLIVI